MSPADTRKASDKLWDITTPIFTPAMGQRLKLARMKMLWSQAELGNALGISQQQVGRLEDGRQQTMINPFTTGAMRGALGKHFEFVAFGSRAELYNPASIGAAFWNSRHAPKGNRTNHGHQLRK